MITARVKIAIYNAIVGQKDMPAWELADRILRVLAENRIGFIDLSADSPCATRHTIVR